MALPSSRLATSGGAYEGVKPYNIKGGTVCLGDFCFSEHCCVPVSSMREVFGEVTVDGNNFAKGKTFKALSCLMIMCRGKGRGRYGFGRRRSISHLLTCVRREFPRVPLRDVRTRQGLRRGEG